MFHCSGPEVTTERPDQPAPLLLGFVHGPLTEESVRRALLISRGNFPVFVTRPISATFIAITAALLVWALWSTWRDMRRRARAQPAA